MVLLCGDTAQLPPVKRIPLRGSRPTESSKVHDINGVLLFKQFQTCTILTESNRLDTAGSEYNMFKTLLQQLRDGQVSSESWTYLKDNNTFSMGREEWIQRSFNADHCVHFYCTNAKVNKRNKDILFKSKHPIVKPIFQEMLLGIVVKIQDNCQ